jgi:glycosyltransferase involved in cell wall biosynthesis
MNRLVTIAIPTYNRADGYLPEAIQAALAQTYPHIEVIVSDNCSTDNTAEVVRRFNDPRVIYCRHERNIGHNNNFNFCLKQARGEYFMLLPDDDLIDPDFVECCLEHCHHRTDIGVIHTGIRVIDEDGTVSSEARNPPRGETITDYVRGWFSTRNQIYLSCTLFVTEKLREIGGFGSKHNLAQDSKAKIEIAARHGWIDVEEVKASIRRHSGEITYMARLGHSCEEVLMLLDFIEGLVPEQERRRVRQEGLLFFSRGQYVRARRVRGRAQRLNAYLLVLRRFGLRYPPPLYHFMPGFGLLRWWRRIGRKTPTPAPGSAAL